MPGSKLTKWIQNRVDNLPFRKPSEDRPPYLPSPRPRPLTPTSSAEVLVQPPSCLLFTQLPALIRRDILLLAFGNRTLHMDLVFDLPLYPPPEEHAWDTPLARCARRHAAIYKPDFEDNMEKLVPRAWRWCGCACHASRILNRDLLQFNTGIYAARNIHNDRCLEGVCEIGRSKDFKLNWPDDCQIRIMGFMLSCRQAYAETIDILYGANNIAISSEVLLLHLPRLILPQRLGSITSLELVVNAHAVPDGNHRTRHDYSHLTTILGNVSTHCQQSLRTLTLSLICRRSSDPKSILDDPALRSVDKFYLAMQLRDMRLELPNFSFEICRKRAFKPDVQHALEKQTKSEFWWRMSLLWRCFDDELAPQTQVRSSGSYPNPPLQLPTPENEGERVVSRGYWIGPGLEDYRRNRWMVCF
ncbi:hypothetical protein F5X68DRAFT_198686 [Plectosphaerella plurivora]|uniref:DUF7730 domain-containing protein n=1 Tax=Plectosphaerella plurivora TaxID=936078 RepID=A0A9P8VKK5_9PEZI|nr:hypothetical protein F5X68DRAFT_198686 [Plectosphaerella plurivora]